MVSVELPMGSDDGLLGDRGLVKCTHECSKGFLGFGVGRVGTGEEKTTDDSCCLLSDAGC